MSDRIKIAIVGRPNVGKSALFNALCGQRLAIVDEAEGVTRDRLYCDLTWKGWHLELIDTGGIDTHAKLPHNEQVRRQAEIAIEEADVLIMVVDGTVGVNPLDRQVASILQHTSKPIVLAVNKIDSPAQQGLLPPFHALGIENLIGVSAVHRAKLQELLWLALEEIPKPEEAPESRGPRVAVVGRPNVGKSTLVNAICGQDRCIVGDEAGTTRDAIDVPIEVDGKPYVLVDTAGIRRKKSEKEVIDKFAAMRTELAVERSDVCLLMLDVREGITAQEKRIAQMIEQSGKGCVLLFNKWDMVKGFRMEHCMKAIRDEVPFLGHCPAIFLSAKTGRNLDKVFAAIDHVVAAAHQRVTTGQLNRFLEGALKRQSPPMILGKRLKIYYLTQVGKVPPKFVIFVNNPDLMTDTYKKYLINRFREEFDFSGCPLVFYLRGKGRHDEQRDD
jgi:GTP-binding protein